MGLLRNVLEHIEKFLEEDALVVVELSARTPEPQWPSSYQRESSKKWGETMVWFLTFSRQTGSVEA